MQVIVPDWSVPAAVHAATTTRAGGHSAPSYDSFNLAMHVADDPDRVRENRIQLERQLSLPSEPVWLNQVHGKRVIDAARMSGSTGADAAFTTEAGVVCAVLTADCLPVLFCDQDAECVAAAHAGWRGLAAGVLEATVAAMPVAASRISAWLGPAIGVDAFVVGSEVRERFIRHQAAAAGAFRARSDGTWTADIYALARQRLAAAGVYRVSGGAFCTYRDRDRFYSYRREGVTGRMASLIWIAQP